MEAIISDIHANLPALEAVLRDVERFGVRRVVCLGDIIGYGPFPLECVDLAMGFEICLRGNHEDAVLFEPVGFNVRAEEAIHWTLKQLNDRSVDRNLRRARWNFLGDLKTSHSEGDVLYVHGTPREPTREYLFPKDVTDSERMESIFARIKRICFCGHTHIAGIFTPKGVVTPPVDRRIDLTGFEKVMVNVGAVGQPRDGDWRACYILFDGNSVVYRRVPYDIERTVNAILATPELDNYLAERLRRGT
ncbi:MAG: metallophosphoesterase [Planctomycetota bacterium]|nr:MAG: metallophosphoesterase [Planctomycetota bacterium]